MTDVDLTASQLYDRCVAERGPRWDQLGAVTKNVWRARVLHDQTFSHDNPDMLTTKQVSERIGVTMTVPFIVDVLGVQPSERVKNGCLWSETAYANVCAQLVAHVQACAAGMPAAPESCDDLFS